MSPTERELRASLHQGEGEPIDVDRIVAVGAAARSQRRTRLVSVAAAVVVVLAAGTVTGVVLARDGGDGTTSAERGASANSPQRAAGVAPGDPAPAPSSSSASRSDTVAPSRTPVPAACPVSFSQRSLPGGAQSGTLFDRPAASITVCGYGSSLSAPNPSSFTVTGTRATELQRSLENARSNPANTPCSAVRSNDRRSLAFVAVDAAGRAMRVVTTTLSVPICDTRTTNGVVVRYGWVPPLGVRQQLYALTPSGVASAPIGRVPSGKNIGSPVR